MVALQSDVVGKGTIMICEALALARGFSPREVPGAVAPYVPRQPYDRAFLEEVAGASGST
jgi:hypothetical protein